MPCSKVARAQLVTQGVRSLPSGVRALGWDCRGHLIGLPGPGSSGPGIATTGLHKVPYYWAGVFVLEAARFLYPAQHFALIDNDCVPITLFEAQDLLQLAHQQHRWVDLIGHVRSESSPSAGIGMLLFTEAHLEYNAGLVISIGNRNKHSPLEHDTSALTLAKSLQAGRLALVSRARPPVNPSDTVISGTLFTPFVGIAMQTALDLCMVWSLYGLYMCKHFWPMPIPGPASAQIHSMSVVSSWGPTRHLREAHQAAKAGQYGTAAGVRLSTMR